MAGKRIPPYTGTLTSGAQHIALALTDSGTGAQLAVSSDVSTPTSVIMAQIVGEIDPVEIYELHRTLSAYVEKYPLPDE